MNGVLTGDTVSLIGGTAAFADKNVGISKIVALSGAVLSGSHAGNYSLTSVATKTADITPKNLTISGAIAQEKTYDGNNVATVSFSAASLTGVISSDLGGVSVDSTGCTAAFMDMDAGNAKSVSVIFLYFRFWFV